MYFQLNLNPIGNDGAMYLFKTVLDAEKSALVDINISVSACTIFQQLGMTNSQNVLSDN